ncbi:MAG: hypothetical protein AB1489_02570 [Acidobacteriota bacterium]
MNDREIKEKFLPLRWQRVSDIPDFPFDNFAELQQALSAHHYSLGIDSLTAARLSPTFSSWLGNILIKLLSLLLCASIIAVLTATIWLSNYWLLLGVPIVAVMFVISSPTISGRQLFSIIGGLAILLALDCWLRDLSIAACLFGMAGYTFVAVRLANYITRTSLCEAIAADESIFLYMFERASCTIRDNKTGRVYQSPPNG